MTNLHQAINERAVVAGSNSDPPASGSRSGDSRHLHLAISLIVLAILGYPSISVALPDRSDEILLLLSFLAAAFTFPRYLQTPWPTLWLLLYVLTYAISSVLGTGSQQGLVHTLALACVAIVFLTATSYGAELLSSRLFILGSAFVLLVNAFTLATSNLPKNAAAGALVFVTAIAYIILLRNADGAKWSIVISFYLLGIVIALSFDAKVRSLIIYMTFFLLAYAVSRIVKPQTYRTLGIVSTSVIITGAFWFFLNIRSSAIAPLARLIEDISGQRANTGRTYLWSNVLRKAAEDPFFGLGAGFLPSDFLNTRLSSHNYYLQVYLQVGLLGLAILLGALLSMWLLVSRSRTTVGKFGSALFLMFVVHNGTEAIMFQNSTLVAVPAWFAIGLSLSADIQSRNETYTATTGRESAPTSELPARTTNQNP